jgi:hypothetical protein
MRGSLTSLTVVSFSQIRSCTKSSGAPASCMSFTSSTAESGVPGAGLTNTGHPAANAVTTWWIKRLNGWLNALTAKATPRGSR